MDKSLEGGLYLAVVAADNEAVTQLLSQGANPNKTTSHGKTCLGEAAKIGNVSILKQLIDTKYSKAPIGQRQTKTQKRKLRHDSKNVETIAKCSRAKALDSHETELSGTDSQKLDKNLGYYVFVHNEGSCSDESRVPPLKSPISPPAMTPSPQGDLEWDEEIGIVAPTTSEDETWSSMYKWYASILECTGAALASACAVSCGVDQQDAFSRTALHYAAEQGHTAAVTILIEAGCKVDVAATDGLTPLHVAVGRNNMETVKVLLSHGSTINYKTHEKMTPLHLAASRGYLELVQILVGNGAYLEARDTNERTPLYLAAGRGHSEVVQYLISAGANVNGEEIHGYTPLCEAVWQRYSSVVEVLLQHGARITHSHKLLHNAIVQRQEELVKLLANHGGGINLHNENGDTPLLLATRLSLHKVVDFLLLKGANVNYCNNITGANALHIAVESVDDAEVFEAMLTSFLKHKINMDATALTGDTALNRALLLHKDDAAKLLIRYGADVNTCDLHSCGLDNLAIASRRKSPSLSELLLKAGHYTTLPESYAAVAKPGTAMSWLQNACRQPLSLSDLCRISVRKSCGKQNILFLYISSLPLPKSLKQFLMLEEH